ncbi:MAG: hypothetical protein Q7U16_11695 [Agitococcus sp.]|nr:hypothetical protein [Agitococcus sp.]
MSNIDESNNINQILIEPTATVSKIKMVQQDSIWLNHNQLGALFQRDKSVISRHIRNIFAEDELERVAVVADFATTAYDGKSYQIEHFNLMLLPQLPHIQSYFPAL